MLPKIQDHLGWSGLKTVDHTPSHSHPHNHKPCTRVLSTGRVASSPGLQTLLSALPTPRSHLGPWTPRAPSAGSVPFWLGSSTVPREQEEEQEGLPHAGPPGDWCFEQHRCLEGTGRRRGGNSGLRRKSRDPAVVLKRKPFPPRGPFVLYPEQVWPKAAQALPCFCLSLR